MKQFTNITHISFDMWNTLISANKQFAAARNQYLADQLNLDISFVSNTYSKTKQIIDENPLYCSNVFQAHLTLAGKLNRLFEYDVEKTIAKFNELFQQYPPVVLPGTIRMLKKLNKQHTLSIASNTNFISGETLQQVLVNHWGVDFKFQIYSDLCGFAKPSLQIFNNVIGLAKQHNPHVVSSQNILHIGDSAYCDYQGSSIAQINAMLISNPQDLINQLG